MVLLISKKNPKTRQFLFLKQNSQTQEFYLSLDIEIHQINGVVGPLRSTIVTPVLF